MKSVRRFSQVTFGRDFVNESHDLEDDYSQEQLGDEHRFYNVTRLSFVLYTVYLQLSKLENKCY